MGKAGILDEEEGTYPSPRHPIDSAEGCHREASQGPSNSAFEACVMLGPSPGTVAKAQG